MTTRVSEPPTTTPAGAPRTPPIASRLPGVGTTIFTVMSALAAECGAVNLGQGFPDFDGDPRLVDAVARAMREGRNQYPPMAGVAALRQAVADKVEAVHGRRVDPEREVTITAGATQAILTAALAALGPGDEAIVLDPSYDCHAPAVRLAGATPVRIALGPGFRPDVPAIARALTPRTKLVVVNSPNNPGASVWRREDFDALAEALAPTDVLVLSDEVYEHIVFDGHAHVGAHDVPALAARAFVVSSFGKTFHVTGWKVGAVVAPPALTDEFRRVHQFNVFTVNTPMQHGLAEHLADPAPWRDLPAFYQAKRDRLRAGLDGTRLGLLPCEGSYFQVVDYSGVGGAAAGLGERDFCEWLTREVGVAAIPLAAFYADGRDQGLARLCFAKRDATLDEALARLRRAFGR